MAGINFTSVNTIQLERDNLRNAREKVIEKAKWKYEKEEKKRQEAAARGDDKWMLQSITDRIASDKKTSEKAKKKQKKEKKKLKKEKKKKKKKDRRKEESSDSDSDSDSEKEDAGVEKGGNSAKPESKPSGPIKGPMLQRDSWMEEGGMFDMPTTSRKEIRDKIQREKDERNAEKTKIEEEARLKIELNPYWQNGGTGLPEEDPGKKNKAAAKPAIGDGGVSWLKKSFERCKQQAAEEGRSLEELAAERWGSLKAFKKMLAEAEKRQAKQRPERSPPRWKRGERSRSPEKRRQRSRSRSPERNRSRSRSHSPKHRRDSPRRDRYDNERSSRKFIRPGDSDQDQRGERSRFMKPSDSNSNSDRRRSEHSDYDKSRDGRSRAFMRPEEDESRSRRQFMRPSEEGRTEDRHSSSSSRGDSYRGSYKSHSEDRRDEPRWRKKGFEKPRQSSPPRIEEKRREDERRSRKRSVSTSSSSSSSSSESESEVAPSSEEEEPTPAPTILSEKEMNELGAKILRAEIMGDNNLAGELKAKLEAARKAREENPKGATSREKSKSEPEEILLTRTTRGGLVQPLPEQQHERPNMGKKKKKQKKVSTHGSSGDRERYFDDDDKHSLKSLVEQERRGTAEDQNAMFARLAGRSTEKTDEDYQMDDVIISKAARQQSEAQTEERDRARAIMEHRKTSSAMEKCRFCFDKVPKHLIIAIGVKTYLCLPNHRSLTPGHCLIVPMQHVTSGTVVDEDIWQEIQTFRKCLVRLFESRDEDIVFMETSMHLKHLPHMCIECVPVEKETGDLAPIYFKKAIQDVGPEWSQNKKLVDLSKKDVRRSIPKGFPYFSVDFGMQGGFAHVIEDEQTFPSYFGREIVGGMVDAEPGLWRKPHKESFEVQRKKVLEFAEWWKPFDWTTDLKGTE